MTLPFRRRHHDNESAHDRARALTSREMLEPIDAADASWLEGHLDGCAECRQDREAYLADRELLRSLRDRAPEPPRDLWARTSAALDREARNRPVRVAGARPRTAGAGRGWRGFPLAPAVGVGVLLLVIGASLVPPILRQSPTTGPTAVAQASIDVEPTQINIDAARVGWVRPAADGSWEFVLSNVDAVCPRPQAGCQPLGEDAHGRPVPLGNTPTSITISPDEHRLVVESVGTGPAPDKILIVPVPSATPVATAEPQPTAATPGATETPPPTSPEPSADSGTGVIEIASGVVIVGETAYSADSQWLAFSARPSDGSTGPDLYLWHVGDLTAHAVTTDHQTYFSAWLGNQVLASRVEVPSDPVASAAPGASADPGASAPASPDATQSDPTASEAPASASPAIEAHPRSFLLDPTTLVAAPIAVPDVWLPVVDPTGRFVTYWSGTLTGSADGTDWRLGTGRLVLDGWSTGSIPDASLEPAPSTPADASQAPAPTAAPEGPLGSPVSIAEGPTAAFITRFDPSGTRLAVWVAEDGDTTVGRLFLHVLDPATGAVDAALAPLPGVPALRRFSIDTGRLAWVSPPGQDGQESSVQVLGWSHDDFGEVRTIPSRDLYIVR